MNGHTATDLARRLNISKSLVYKLIGKGDIYSIRSGQRRIIIPEWAVNELLAKPGAIDENELQD